MSICDLGKRWVWITGSNVALIAAESSPVRLKGRGNSHFNERRYCLPFVIGLFTHLSPFALFRRSLPLHGSKETSTSRVALSYSVFDLLFASLGPKTVAQTLVKPCWTRALPSGRCVDVPGKVEIPSRGASGDMCKASDRNSSGRRPSNRNEPLFRISSRDISKGAKKEM